MSLPPDRGEPISYLVLAEGTPVHTREGTRIGTVKRVLAIPDEDVFDGLIVETGEGRRFVDAPNVDELYERAVVLGLSDEEAGHLPEPTPHPPDLEVTPDDVVPDTPAERVGHAIRRAWELLSGKY